MDPSLSSIQEPPRAPPISLETLREQISKLEGGLKGREYPLSGRILHLTHYLPVVATLNSKSAKPAPQETETPPADTLTEAAPTSLSSKVVAAVSGAASTVAAALAPTASSEEPSTSASASASSSSSSGKWTVSNRRGHTAMVSGIKSLAATHEQLVIGWTGPVSLTPSVDANGDEKAEEETLASADDVTALQSELEAFDKREGEGRVKNVPVWLDKEVAKGHYEGYCKTTLWPLFHYLLWQDVASEYPLEDPNFRPYYEANMAFAKKVAEVHRPGDLIFIHDYHLLLAPKMIRELIPDANIALFIHAPFPSSEIFRCLPKRNEILEGMLGANLVCFQTYSYSRHFISTCIRVCGFETTPAGVDAHGTVTAVSYCPIGIDCERVIQDRNGAGVGPKVDALRALYAGKKIIVGREKLDVSKGVVEKLQAFEKLLECYPEWRGKVVLIQVTQPSLSDSPKLERTVSELVSHINGLYGSLDFTPVHHYHQTIARDEYFALLSVADLALITALRDGMNTTSMEFAICQDKTSKAPIVLSEFMGTASSFGSALLINPHDVLGVAAAINQGLTMGQEEKERRHAEVYEQVTSHSSGCWAASVLKVLLENIGGEHSAHEMPLVDKSLMKAKYDAAKKRLMLFDYDGTLTPIVKVPSEATPTPRTLAAISKLAEDPRNIVYLISGRDGDFLHEHWGHVKSLGLSAEHGCFLRPPGGEGWKGLTEKLDMNWMSEVQEIFQYYTERTSGSHIELKKASVTWHYRQSDPDFGSFQCKQCHDLLESTLATRRPIEVLVGKKNLEVRPLAINKGEIVRSIIYQHPEAEFIFCAGDDKTDEDMFRALRQVPALETMAAPIAITSTCTPEEIETLPEVKIAVTPEGIFSTAVGVGKVTLANYHVPEPSDVVEAMEALLA